MLLSTDSVSFQGKHNSSFLFSLNPHLFHDDKSAFGSSIVQGRLVAVPVDQGRTCAFGDEKPQLPNFSCLKKKILSSLFILTPLYSSKEANSQKKMQIHCLKPIMVPIPP